MLQSLLLKNYLIDGSKGPYSKNTNSGRSANAGYEFAKLLSGENAWKLNQTDVQYSNIINAYDDRQYFRMPDPKVNVRSTLAFSTEALKGYDSNKDGTVSVAEFNSSILNKSVQPGLYVMRDPNYSPKFGQTVDLNNDGKIDAGELSAWQIYQDGTKQIGHDGINYSTSYNKSKVDGKVTVEEARLAEQQVNKNPNDVKAQLQQIYKDNNIAETQETFKMPPKVGHRPNTGNQDIIQMLMQLIQQLLGGFGRILF